MGDSNLLDQQMKFSASDTPGLEEYRSICGMSVFAFLLTLASLLVVLDPMVTILYILPFAAIALSIGALRIIAKNPNMLIGRKLAIVSLLAALFIAAYAPARSVSRSQAILGEGRRFAQHWFEVVQKNQPREAHQLSLESIKRRNPDQSLDDFYNERSYRPPMTSRMPSGRPVQMDPTEMMDDALKDNQRSYDQFINNSLVKELFDLASQNKLALGWKSETLPANGAVVQFVEVEAWNVKGTSHEIRIRYDLKHADDHVHRMRVTLKREVNDDNQIVQWQFATIKG